MKLLLQWLLVSSADPGKISLAVRGFLVALIPTVLAIAGFTGITVPDQDGLMAVVDLIVTLIQLVLGIVSAVMMIIGVARKIWRTITGRNEVINANDRGDL